MIYLSSIRYTKAMIIIHSYILMATHICLR